MNKIGIDFGTTKTLVSYFDSNKRESKLIRLGRGKDEIPTSIFIERNGTVLIGDDADDVMIESPQYYTTGRAFKLGLGDDSVILDGQSAHKLTAIYLKEIKSRCEEEVFHGETIDEVTLTIPVNFSPIQKSELEGAAKDAGFKNIKLLKEPEAAGKAYLHQSNVNATSNILILDWGGGTVDVALLHKEDDSYKANQKFTWGRDDIGGEYFDELLFDHVSENKNIELDERNRRRVKEGKEILSSRQSHTIRMIINNKIDKIDISRSQFTKIIDADVKIVATKIKKMIKGIPAEQKPSEIVLIGGTSKIPLIKEMVEKETALPCTKWQFSHEAVALGASIEDEINTKNDATELKRRQFVDERIQLFHDEEYVLKEQISIISFKLDILFSHPLRAREFINENNLEHEQFSNVICEGLDFSLETFEQLKKYTIEAIKYLFTGKYDIRINDWIETFLGDYSGMLDNPMKKYSQIVSSEIENLRKDYNEILEIHKQLLSEKDRFYDILNPSGWGSFFKWGLGGLLAVATWGTSLAVAYGWDKWKQMNDEDFLSSYLSTYYLLCQKCIEFMNAFTKILNDNFILCVSDNEELEVSYKTMLEKITSFDTIESIKTKYYQKKNSDPGLLNYDTQECFSMILNDIYEDSDIPSEVKTRLISEYQRCGYCVLSNGKLDDKLLRRLNILKK